VLLARHAISPQVANATAQSLAGTEFSDPIQFARGHREFFGDGKTDKEIEAFRLELVVSGRVANRTPLADLGPPSVWERAWRFPFAKRKRAAMKAPTKG
jgi:hypothetical protein